MNKEDKQEQADDAAKSFVEGLIRVSQLRNGEPQRFTITRENATLLDDLANNRFVQSRRNIDGTWSTFAVEWANVVDGKISWHVSGVGSIALAPRTPERPAQDRSALQAVPDQQP